MSSFLRKNRSGNILGVLVFTFASLFVGAYVLEIPVISLLNILVISAFVLGGLIIGWVYYTYYDKAENSEAVSEISYFIFWQNAAWSKGRGFHLATPSDVVIPCSPAPAGWNGVPAGTAAHV